MVNSNLDQIHRADPRRIVQKHDPSYLPLVEKIGIHALIDNEQEALREIIASELTIVGLDFDGEPTQGPPSRDLDRQARPCLMDNGELTLEIRFAE